ncbi:MAG: FAD-dependent oxidoreductase [Mesorhizobium sp.]
MERRILVAGGGIAGLSAALALSRQGLAVTVLEQAAAPASTGAGIQLSPNATRLLQKLGALERLEGLAVRPDSVTLRDARSLVELARLPLGDAAEKRWGAPYLTAQRADLQGALAQAVAEEQLIEVRYGRAVEAAAILEMPQGVQVDRRDEAGLLIGADGVWSAVRQVVRPGAGRGSRFTGALAWRATVGVDSAAAGLLAQFGAARQVVAFLDPNGHMIVYPIAGGRAFNLVAFSPGPPGQHEWSADGDISSLLRTLHRSAKVLHELIGMAPPWTVFPVHAVDASAPWTRHGRLALVGDAAHAMTPYAAQGAAMAIEDAVTLAEAIVGAGPQSQALSAWEDARRRRVLRVARRGAFNRFVWHARGPVAFARNLVLGLRSPDRLAADLDWLYGWRP